MTTWTVTTRTQSLDNLPPKGKLKEFLEVGALIESDRTQGMSFLLEDRYIHYTVGMEDRFIPASAATDGQIAPTQTEILFESPVRAPDFFVSSPKPKDDPALALADAIAEGAKSSKSIALIVLSLVKYLEDVEKRLKKAKI